jgi:hypothetical protein
MGLLPPGVKAVHHAHDVGGRFGCHYRHFAILMVSTRALSRNIVGELRMIVRQKSAVLSSQRQGRDQCDARLETF